MAGSAVAQRSSRQRADASRNHERIVAAARALFIEQGAEAPLDEIAQRAGVGNATLYRHFAGRRELIHVVVVSLMSGLVDQVELILAEEPDPFEGLRRFVHTSADAWIGAVCSVFSGWLDPADPELTALQDRLTRAVESLLQRARHSGQLRGDVEIGDVIVPIVQLARPIPGTDRVAAERFVHRHLELLLDGLRAPQRSVLPGCAATVADLRRSTGRPGTGPAPAPTADGAA